MTSHKKFMALLKALGITNDDLAIVLGVNRRTAYRWASGETEIPTYVGLVMHLMMYYNLSVNEMVSFQRSKVKG